MGGCLVIFVGVLAFSYFFVVIGSCPLKPNPGLISGRSWPILGVRFRIQHFGARGVCFWFEGRVFFLSFVGSYGGGVW